MEWERDKECEISGTCCRARGRRRRRSCSAVVWGPSWTLSLPSPAGHSGNTGACDTLALRTWRSTHLIQTPDLDWTNPEEHNQTQKCSFSSANVIIDDNINSTAIALTEQNWIESWVTKQEYESLSLWSSVNRWTISNSEEWSKLQGLAEMNSSIPCFCARSASVFMCAR